MNRDTPFSSDRYGLDLLHCYAKIGEGRAPEYVSLPSLAYQQQEVIKMLLLVLPYLSVRMYSRITFTKTPLFCLTTFSASFTKPTTLLFQSHDSSCYVSRQIPAPPPLWLQKHTDPRAHDFAQSPDLWHQSRFVNVTCAWGWRFCGINPALKIQICRRPFQEILCFMGVTNICRHTQILC